MLIGNRYELHEQIGAGGMGTVFRGVDTQTGETVAIKRLKEDAIVQDPGIIERFQREAEALRQLNHPNIVKVLATADQDDGHFIIMEYIGGGSLKEVLHPVPAKTPAESLPVPRILSIALDLADALTRAHRLNIIHRDLKPANVLIAPDGTPRLTDFGVAHIGNLERVTNDDAVIGTLDYLPPEALNNEGIDARGDIWSFGVMLFELLTGKRPFSTGSIGQIFSAILTQPAPDLEVLRPDCPVRLVDLVYRMLEKNRDARISSVRLVGAELEAILRGETRPTAASPVSGTASIADNPTIIGEKRFETPASGVDNKIRHNLPAEITPFIGREHEIEELSRLLKDPAARQITILAPGGMGKTRLSLKAAEQQFAAFPNGVYFVALAPIVAVENIVPAVAEAVGFQFYTGGEPRQQLVEYFRERRLLLVIDNFEHVLEGVGLVNDILQAAPGVRVIATSRQRLNLSGETVFNLSGMDFPDWETPEDALEYSAVRLFMQSARRVRLDFELKADDLKYVARICRMVQGMPLGILLAAAWVDSLSLPEIVDEIGKSLDFLETEMADIPARQRSIRAVFDYSWNLLNENERLIFSRLAVFRGRFTREAAGVVAEAGLRQLTALVNKSLLRRDADSGRYEVHELLRQYGEEQLEKSGKSEVTKDAHSAYFARWLEQLWDDLKGRRQVGALNDIEADFDNVRAAWMHMVAGRKADELHQAANSLWNYCDIRDLKHETNRLFGEAVDCLRKAPVNDVQQRALGNLLARQGWIYVTLATQESIYKGEQAAREGLAILRRFGSSEEIILALDSLGFAAAYLGQYSETVQAGNDALKIAQETGNLWAIRHIMAGFSSASIVRRDFSEARHSAEESYLQSRSVGDLFSAAHSAVSLAYVTLHEGNYQEATRLTLEGLALFEALKRPWGISEANLNLMRIALVENNIDEAKHCFRRSLQVIYDIGIIPEILDRVFASTEILLTIGEKARAVEIMTMINTHPLIHGTTENSHYGEKLAALAAELSPEVFAAATERGKRLKMEEVITELLKEDS